MLTDNVAFTTAKRTTTGTLMVPENLARKAAPKTAARLVRNPTMLSGLLIVGTYLVLALLGEWLAPYPYTEQHLADALQPSSLRYPLGTDQFGRDIFSHVIVGSRSMIILATAATLFALTLGTFTGVVAAYHGGLVDEMLMRITDVLLAFPALSLALLMLSSLDSALIYLISAIGLVFAPAIARVLRSVVLELKTREFGEAAQMIGATAGRIMVRQIWPNLFNTLLVEAAIYFGYADV